NSAACFEAPSAYEITIDGKKLMGSAQSRPAGRVLQHGSLPLGGDIARVAEYLSFTNVDDRAALRAHLGERATTLRHALGRDVAFTEVAEALRDGFATALTLDLTPGVFSAAELSAAEARLPLVRVNGSGMGSSRGAEVPVHETLGLKPLARTDVME